MASAGANRALCHFFSTGSCNGGEACRFKHSGCRLGGACSERACPFGHPDATFRATVPAVGAQVVYRQLKAGLALEANPGARPAPVNNNEHKRKKNRRGPKDRLAAHYGPSHLSASMGGSNEAALLLQRLGPAPGSVMKSRNRLGASPRPGAASRRAALWARPSMLRVPSRVGWRLRLHSRPLLLLQQYDRLLRSKPRPVRQPTTGCQIITRAKPPESGERKDADVGFSWRENHYSQQGIHWALTGQSNHRTLRGRHNQWALA
jgi:hypothetical protein